MLVSIIMVLKTQELLGGHEEAAHYMTDTVSQGDEPIDLRALGFDFALNQIDPRIGRVEVEQVRWRIGEPKQSTPIEMVDCETL